MKKALWLAVVVAFLVVVAQPAAGDRSQLAEATEAPRAGSVLFIENDGQWDDRARYQVWGGPGGTMWLADDGIWITVIEPERLTRRSRVTWTGLSSSRLTRRAAPSTCA